MICMFGEHIMIVMKYGNSSISVIHNVNIIINKQYIALANDRVVYECIYLSGYL